MTYRFEPYLDAASTDWYGDDALLHALLRRYAPARGPDADRALSAWGGRVAGRLRVLAEESALPANHPRLRPFDAYGRRVDEVLLPASTMEALAEVEGGQRLGAVHGDPFVFYAMGYLYAQNGEAGVACSMACTDGLVRALEALGDRPVHREAVERVRSSTPERFDHGAQFVTEVQGGSDVPANAVEAVPEGDAFRLRGRKWFCSNVNADWFLVTARPTGAPAGGRGVGLFLVPAYREGVPRRRNGYTIDRLKDKLGTRELATAEVTFDDARAYPVGAPERGIANLLTHVLTPSRMACVSFAASALRRAERIVADYTGFRTAFGRRLDEYPAVAATVEAVGSARALALATFFELLRLWPAGAGTGGAEALDFRVLLGLSKAVLTRQATALLHDSMLLLGGNGVEERFSPLPRLYRDSVIMETWEGPYNVLLDQALRDLARFGADPAAFVARVAGEPREDLARDLGAVLGAAGDPAALLPFGPVAERLVRAVGERALAGLPRP